MADPGWYPDPYTRYEVRWFDGSQWTAHVRSNDVATVDPLGSGFEDNETTGAPSDPNDQIVAGETRKTGRPLLRMGEPARSSEDDEQVASGSGAPTPQPAQTSPQTAQPSSAAPSQVGPSGASPATPTGNTPEILLQLDALAQRLTSRVSPFLHTLGPDALNRPAPSFTNSLAAGGGLLALIGLLLLTGDSTSQATLAMLAGLVIAGTWLVMSRIATSLTQLRHAAVAAAFGAIPLFAFAVTNDATLDDFAFSSPTGALAIASFGFLAGWALPGFKGRPTFLAAGLITGISMLSSAAASRPDFRECEYSNCGFAEELTEALRYSIGVQSWLLLFAGIILMLVALTLDRSEFHGVATGFIFAGLVILGSGLINIMGAQPGLVTSLLAAAAGVLVCVVGAAGQRRATTWIGATAAVAGLSTAPILAFDPEDSAAAGILALITAAVIIGVPSVVLRRATRSK